MRITRKPTGFTLIEVMIALVIVSILAAIAVPSYQDSVRKGRRADGMTALLHLQLAQEKWRANHTSYSSTLGGGGLGLSSSSSDGYYTLAITAASSTGFTATATPKTGTAQAGDTCTFTITQDGPDLSTAAHRSCWNRN